MRGFHLTIQCRETNEVVETTRDEIAEGPVLIGGQKVVLAGGVLVCDHVRLADDNWVEGRSGQHYHLRAKELFKRAEDLEPRLRHAYCMNCYHWDRAEGIRLYEEQTHKYGDGSYSRIEQIIRAVAQHNKTRPLTPTNIGYCPVLQRLCAESAKACVENYDKRPWPARLRNWWTRMFR